MELSNFKPQPVPRERTSNSVLQVLRDSILSGVFVPGQRLNTSELAQKLDVSVAPVRDALNRLQSEGLIEIRPRSGTFVSEISPREVRETFEDQPAEGIGEPNGGAGQR
jgi:GntR family transcriptional regulator, rspAB operon transcriptional repressor